MLPRNADIFRNDREFLFSHAWDGTFARPKGYAGSRRMSINLVDGFTLTISDPDNLLGSNQAALITDMNYVVTLLSTYIVFQKPLDLQINFAPASQNPNNTDGLLPSAPAWVNYQGQETLAAMVKGQTGVDPNGSRACPQLSQMTIAAA